MGRPHDTDYRREKYDSNKHKELVNIPKPQPPSIPAKKVSHQSYSAVGGDTVGPALYDPKFLFPKHRAPFSNFYLSKQNRRVFEPSIEISN